MITLEFIPHSEIEGLPTGKRIKKLLDIAKENKIVLLEGQLGKDEETELIKATMTEINERFKGVEVSINTLNDHFKKHFLDLVEENVPAAELIGTTIRDNRLVTRFFQERGNRVMTTLAHIWELLTKQGQCQKGDLVIGQNTKNAFIVSDGNGTLWEIRIWPALNSWNIEACWLNYPRGVSDIYRVFSR